MKELLKKLRRYEIQIRKAVTSQMQGDFHSLFKGSGLEFDDVRPYQYGDDVRTIDWKVSAKGHGTFVKTFKEEKEQTIFFLFDVSASQEIGVNGRSKMDIAKEVCGVLAISGAKEASQIGLICYSDVREKALRPRKGMAQAYEILHTIVSLKPSSRKTNLSKAISFAQSFIKRRSVIVVISDFIDENYFTGLKSLARKHDVVLVRITDKRETDLPKLGIVPVQDKESNRIIWVNSSFGGFRSTVTSHSTSRQQELTDFSRKNQINFVSIDTNEDYVPKLLKLFKVRNKTVKAA